MPKGAQQVVYASDGWEIDLARRELRLRGAPVPLGSRAFEIIEVLVQAAGELVNKNDIMVRVWPGAIIEDNTLQFHISAIRKALGSDRAMLKTVSGRGYRLLGPWSVQQDKKSVDARDREPGRTSVRQYRTNVPVAASALIGRATAAHRVRGLLSAYRLVTLTGPGGIGKTVLALEVARSLFPSFQGDVCLVELGSLTDPYLVPSAVAGVLDLQLGGGEISSESVARAIREKNLLLVLDNCEHVIDAAARLAETIMRLCPSVCVLATSREILRIDGEYVYRVAPLDVSPLHQEDPGSVLEQSAVRLFIARAAALSSDFSPDAENLPIIAAICRRLDGIPLAIEFAAARAATLGLEQVFARLNDRFSLLTHGRRTALPRHRTLRATLDWSYELLPEPEQSLLRQLAIFPAGFTLEASIAVMGATAPTVAEGIANLVAKSLVALDRGEPNGRWRLLETIRTYGLEKLVEAGEAERAARCHAEFFRDLVAPTALGVDSKPTVEDIARYAREIDNVRAAADWSFLPNGDLAIGVILTAAFVPVWLGLSLLAECRARCEQALASLRPGLNLSEALRLQLHVGLGVSLYFTMGSIDTTKVILCKALAIAEDLDDLNAQLQTLWVQWNLNFSIGECLAARAAADRIFHVAARTGDPGNLLVAERLIGNTLQYQGKPREAQRCLEHVLQHYTAPTDQRHTMWFHYHQRVLARAMLARVLWLQGFADQAIDEARASLDEAKATDQRITICGVLRLAVCPIALATGDLTGAGHGVAAMSNLATSHNATFWRILARCLEGELLVKRGQFAAGAALLHGALETCERTGWSMFSIEFRAGLAEALAGLGRPGEALLTIDHGLAKSEVGGERWYVAELLRIKGELLLQQAGDSDSAAAETCYNGALETAREQGALFWELRAALSLARLRVRQNRRDEARAVLAPVYDRFTEGFETADLRAARAILALPPGT
jgi:predicted ATPase/DNA-binding winged helix-turn-helix (wHTH) protein